MDRSLILVGGGGHCKSVIEAAESAGFRVLGVLDLPETVGKQILSTRVIGTDDDIPSFIERAEFIISVGFIKNPDTRIRLYDRVKESGGKLATVVASTAYVSQYAVLGEGTVVLHQAFVNAGVKIGNNVILNSATCIEHDVIVGDHCHISTGTMLNGDCRIGKRCFIGSQSVLSNGISVGDDIIIGAGSFVHKSILKKGIYWGNPAKLVE